MALYKSGGGDDELLLWRSLMRELMVHDPWDANLQAMESLFGEGLCEERQCRRAASSTISASLKFL